jgi:hypothetical protein
MREICGEAIDYSNGGEGDFEDDEPSQSMLQHRPSPGTIGAPPGTAKFDRHHNDAFAALVTWKVTAFAKLPCEKMASADVRSLSLFPTTKSPDWPWPGRCSTAG